MLLTELDPTFLKWKDDSHRDQADKIEEADGVQFLCPACFRKNRGKAGTHVIICWKPSVPQSTTPRPGRWNMVGTGYGDLSLVNGSSSVLVRGEPGQPDHWHGHVRNGEVTDC